MAFFTKKVPVMTAGYCPGTLHLIIYVLYVLKHKRLYAIWFLKSIKIMCPRVRDMCSMCVT